MKKYIIIFSDAFDFAKKEIVKELSKSEVETMRKDIGTVVFSNWTLKSVELN